MGANREAVDDVRDMEMRPGDMRPLDDEDAEDDEEEEDGEEASACAANSVDSDSELDVEGLSSYIRTQGPTHADRTTKKRRVLWMTCMHPGKTRAKGSRYTNAAAHDAQYLVLRSTRVHEAETCLHIHARLGLSCS